ncbi:MAG: oligosaccharide flippase family protein, partial [bacterium]|nr:oligosaccharide flippase family protein [bacterium]
TDLLNIPLKLVLISYIIAKIGIVEYGIWSLLAVLGGQIAQMTLSVPQGIVKYVPEYLAQNLFEKVNQVLSTSFVLYIILGFIVFLVAFILQGWIFAAIFHLEPGQYARFNFIFWGTVLVFIGNHIFGIFPSLLNGLQRIDSVSKISMVSNFVEVAVSLVILYLGWGLTGLIGLMIVIDSLTILVYIISAKQLFKPLKISLKLFNLDELKKILKYSLQLQVSGFASQAVVDLPKVFISYFLGTAATGIYDVALKVVAILRKLLMRLISPIMPTASELYALQEHMLLKRLFLQSLRYLYLFGFPLFAFVFAFAPQLIHFWLGQGLDITVAAGTMRWLCVCFWINLTVIPAAYLLNGIGKPKYVMYSAMLTLILMVALTPIAIDSLEYTGAVIAVFISWGLSALILHYNFFRTMQFSLRIIPLKPTVYYPLQIAGITGLFYLAAMRLPMKLAIFIPLSILVFLGYFLLLFWQKHLELYDIDLMQPYIPNRLFLILRSWVT